MLCPFSSPISYLFAREGLGKVCDASPLDSSFQTHITCRILEHHIRYWISYRCTTWRVSCRWNWLALVSCCPKSTKIARLLNLHRRAFLIQVPFTALAILVVSLLLKLPKKDTSDLASKLRRIDFFGAVTLVLTVFTLLFGLDRGGNISWTERTTVLSLLASFVALLLFAFAEMHPSVAREPFAPKRIIAHRSLAAAYLCNFFGFGSSMCTIFNIALYFQAVAGRSASQAGFGLLPAIFGGVSGSLASGILMQRTGKYYWLTAGAYIAEFGGTILISLMTGVVVHNAIGTTFGLLTMSIGNGVFIQVLLFKTPLKGFQELG